VREAGINGSLASGARREELIWFGVRAHDFLELRTNNTVLSCILRTLTFTFVMERLSRMKFARTEPVWNLLPRPAGGGDWIRIVDDWQQSCESPGRATVCIRPQTRYYGRSMIYIEIAALELKWKAIES
jgi:hypothetical protein